jgi:serine/threonine protein kinase
VDFRCDLFSLGGVLYLLTTRELPFPGDDVHAVLYAVAEKMPPPPHLRNTRVPPALSDLIMRLLAKKPDLRPSAAAVVEALNTIAHSYAGPDTVDEPSSPPPRRPSRESSVLALAALAAVIVSGILFVQRAWREGKKSPPEGPAPVVGPGVHSSPKSPPEEPSAAVPDDGKGIKTRKGAVDDD